VVLGVLVCAFISSWKKVEQKRTLDTKEEEKMIAGGLTEYV
jgi:hypothetical protein